MPTFHLSGAEAVALVRFMVSELPASPGGASTRFDALRRRYPESDSARGRAIFLALDCAGCHSGTNVPAWKSAPDLSREATRARPGWLASWLAHPIAIRPFGFFPGTGTRMPDFGLSPSELRALVDALTTGERGTAGSVAVVAPRGAPLSPYRELEAARLMADRSACLGCHAYGGRGGRIGPDLARVRLRRPPAYIWAVLRDPHAAAPRTIMPRSPGSPERDTLFYRLLTSGRSPGPAGRASSEDTAAVIRGARAPDAPDAPDAPGDTLHDGYLDLTDRALRPPDRWMLEDAAAPTTAGERYAQLCSSCHGPAGAGDGFNAPFLPVPPARHADSAGMVARTDARLFNAIYGGGRVLGRSPRMPAFGRSLAREAIWGLVGHIRSLCGCRGPAWYRDNDETGGASHASGRAEPDTALQTRRRR